MLSVRSGSDVWYLPDRIECFELELSTVNFHPQHTANSSKQGDKKSKKLKSNSKWKETEGDDAMSWRRNCSKASIVVLALWQ